MAQTGRADMLVEIGTEELPPKALLALMHAFAEGMGEQLHVHRLSHGAIEAFATPRRLALRVASLDKAQPDRQVELKGPPTKVAFDENGAAQPAAIAFAEKCGVDVHALQRTSSARGEWLTHRATEKGVAAAELLPGLVERVLQALPIPRRMRWGDSDIEFVRPVHWLVLMHGRSVVPGTVLGLVPGNRSRGHRFMTSGELEIPEPADYEHLLKDQGFVIADFAARRARIRRDVEAAASKAGGRVLADDALFDEVTALTEWPVAMSGQFDAAFLELPPEVISASLTNHQRYFPVIDEDGRLLPVFVLVANLESRDAAQVRDGNERVIRPRLADAAFFWEADRRTSLEARCDALGKVVYQQGLGSLRDKASRTARLCEFLASELDVADAEAVRAAELAKCDLLTGMVGEFPELQGTMGRYYALADGEPAPVAEAIGEHYLPRFAGDRVPATSAGRLLALADKLDTLGGIFAIGKAPTGGKDPFGLRRAALGVVRILLEGRLEIGLHTAIEAALSLQPVDKLDVESLTEQLHGFVTGRLRSLYVDQAEVSVEVFDAVDRLKDRANMPLPDFDQRIAAVRAFARMAEAESLAAANKRISNILAQADAGGFGAINVALLQESAEKQLFDALDEALADVRPLQESREYAAVLARLARLKDPVDRFFDEVMVMTDDEALKTNRLALLSRLREPFHSVADISRLSASRP